MPTIRTDSEGYDYLAELLAVTMIPLATAMVLRRPNEGFIPAWFEQRIVAWPAWLRGTPVPTLQLEGSELLPTESVDKLHADRR